MRDIRRGLLMCMLLAGAGMLAYPAAATPDCADRAVSSDAIQTWYGWSDASYTFTYTHPAGEVRWAFANGSIIEGATITTTFAEDTALTVTDDAGCTIEATFQTDPTIRIEYDASFRHAEWCVSYLEFPDPHGFGGLVKTPAVIIDGRCGLFWFAESEPTGLTSTIFADDLVVKEGQGDTASIHAADIALPPGDYWIEACFGFEDDRYGRTTCDPFGDTIIVNPAYVTGPA